MLPPVFFVEALSAIDKVCPRGTAMRLNVEALTARHAGRVGCQADFTVLAAAGAGGAVNVAQQVRGLIGKATHQRHPSVQNSDHACRNNQATKSFRARSRISHRQS